MKWKRVLEFKKIVLPTYIFMKLFTLFRLYKLFNYSKVYFNVSIFWKFLDDLVCSSLFLGSTIKLENAKDLPKIDQFIDIVLLSIQRSQTFFYILSCFYNDFEYTVNVFTALDYNCCKLRSVVFTDYAPDLRVHPTDVTAP